ncbi:MAG: hypothetical protein GXP37_10295 [Chloroflexi bacterium]|nr:hypothetical protein [Chloroflexota bacterium]
MSRIRLAMSPWWAALVLACYLTLPVWAMLSHPGLPATTNGPLPVLKLYAVERGAPPAVATAGERWHTDGVWPYTVARMAHGLSGDGVSAIKISIVLAQVLLVAGCVGWGVRLGGVYGGVLAAVLVAFAPVLLSTLYHDGDVALMWAMAGLAWAGWGIGRGRRRDAVVVVIALIVAWAARPGLGIWISLAALLLAAFYRHPLTLLSVLGGSLLGFFFAQPWTRPVLPMPASAGVALYQLLEPGWSWDVETIGRMVPANFSLGLPLLGLLLVGAWGSTSLPDAGTRPQPWLPHLLIGGLLTLLSLQAVSSRLPFIAQTVPPASLLVLALPFLAMAAVVGWQRLMPSTSVPVWTALFVLSILNAGPALSPSFESYAIPQQPVALFGPQPIMLLSAQPVSAPQAGASFTLDVSWVALQKPDFDYNIFVHVLDAQGHKVAQFDGQPQQGARPMTSWQPGEVISDSLQVPIPADAPQGLRVLLGVYNWQTGVRLLAGDKDAIAVSGGGL